MITEDFCSLEVAKLLKEKGFDELCIFKYNSEGVRMKAGVSIDEWQNSELDDDECSCVSHQMAMKWLREVHHIAINIGWGEIFEDKYQWWCIVLNMDNGNILCEENYHASYEEAVEAALKYILEKMF